MELDFLEIGSGFGYFSITFKVILKKTGNHLRQLE